MSAWSAAAARRDPIELLLVEDNPGDVNLTRIALQQCAIASRLEVAGDGEEALRWLRAGNRPDLILLDLNLPRMDGRELLAALKADPLLRMIPVVVFTTSEAEGDVLDSYHLHANAYIAKPIDMESFTEILRAIDHFWFGVVRLPAR